MSKQPPLNPDGVRAAEELMIRTDRLTKINYLDAERIITAYFSVAQQDALTDVARMRDMVAEAIDNPGESVHEFVSLPDLYQLLDHLAAAQPLLDEIALANLIAWKRLPFGATQFVKLDANAAHAVIELLKPHLAVAQPEVNSFDPRELNCKGWTCGCEPGNYDSCDECQSACNELAGFLNRPEVKP